MHTYRLNRVDKYLVCHSLTLHLCRKLSSTRAITQNEEHYPNPTVFIPERHLNADGKFAEDSVPVFGFGRQVCQLELVALLK